MSVLRHCANCRCCSARCGDGACHCVIIRKTGGTREERATGVAARYDLRARSEHVAWAGKTLAVNPAGNIRRQEPREQQYKTVARPIKNRGFTLLSRSYHPRM